VSVGCRVAECTVSKITPTKNGRANYERKSPPRKRSCGALFGFLFLAHRSPHTAHLTLLLQKSAQSDKTAKQTTRHAIRTTTTMSSISSSLVLPMALTVLGLVAFWISGTTARWKRLVFASMFFLAQFYNTLFYLVDCMTGQGLDDSVIYHLEHGMEGAPLEQHKEVISASVSSVLLSLALALATFKFAPQRFAESRGLQRTAMFAILISFLVHPLSFDLHKQAKSLRSKANLDVAMTVEENSAFQHAYRDPKQIQNFHPDKNIVFLYMESLERTYFDETLYPDDVVPNLKKWEQQAVSFTNLTQTANTGRTIAGLVASMCGIPLVTTGGAGNSMSGVEDFLPGATCLTDMLKNLGNFQAFVASSELAFAGKAGFLRTHGFDTRWGKTELSKEFPNEKFSGWGMKDDVVMDIAFDKFMELSAAEKPFALVHMTMDTHGRNPSKTCAENNVLKGDKSFVDSVRCTDYLVDKFLNRVMETEYGKKTLIVVSSDHLAMPHAQTPTVKHGTRRNLFFVLGADGVSPKSYDTFGTTVDIPATIVSLLGNPGEGFGLGRDLRTGETLATQIPDFPETWIRSMTNSIRKFWLMPNIRKTPTLEVDVKAKRIRLGGRQYEIPLLMSANSQGFVDEIFLVDAGNDKHAVALNKHSGTTISVDRCKNFDSELAKHGNSFCLFVKHSSNDIGQIRLLHPNEGLVSVNLNDVLQPTEPADSFVNATLKGKLRRRR